MHKGFAARDLNRWPSANVRPRLARTILVLAISLPTFLFPSHLWSQMEIGRLSGTVSDASGARVSGAHISLHSPLSGRQTRTLTDDQGQFQFENVPYGSYVLGVSASGFASSTTPVEVRSNVAVQLPVKLAVA